MSNGPWTSPAQYRGVVRPGRREGHSARRPGSARSRGHDRGLAGEFEARGIASASSTTPPAFDREGYYGGADGDYADNGWRFGLLCRRPGALLDDDRPVDILHLHDWQAMPAVLLRDIAYAAYPRISSAPSWPRSQPGLSGLAVARPTGGLATPDEIAQLVAPDAEGLLLLREGIQRAELVNTVSPGYADEVLTPAFGMGMIRSCQARPPFGGILNGLDTVVWIRPETGRCRQTTRARLAGKAQCRRCCLPSSASTRTTIGRCSGWSAGSDPQKGFDLLAHAAPTAGRGGRIVTLGTGDGQARGAAASHRRRAAGRGGGRREVRPRPGRRIYAGVDLYLMPSRFEPCGQGQMIALRYGTPAIVHGTGGLADTVGRRGRLPGRGDGLRLCGAPDDRSPGSMQAGDVVLPRRRRGLGGRCRTGGWRSIGRGRRGRGAVRRLVPASDFAP